MNTETKQAFQDRMEAELKQRRAEIEIMKAKIQKAEANSRMGLEDNLRFLDEQMSAVQDKLESLQESSGEGWKEIKNGISSSWEELSHSLQRAQGKFQNK